MATRSVVQRHYLGAVGEAAAIGVWAAERLRTQPGFYLVVAASQHTAHDIVNYARFHLPIELSVELLPDLGLLPYDYLIAQEAVVAKRLSLLKHLTNRTNGLLVVALPTLLRRLPPPHFIAHSQFTLCVGESFDYSKQRLLDNGYRQVQQVEQAGEFCRRGEVFDIFPIGDNHPLRILLDDDLVETIHTINTTTQRVDQPLHNFSLLARQEFPFDTRARDIFCHKFLATFPNQQHSSLLLHAKNGTITSGYDSFLPLFFENTLATLFDFIPRQAIVITEDNQATKKTLHQWHALAQHRLDMQKQQQLAALPVRELLLTEQELFVAYKSYHRYIYNVHKEATRFTPIDALLAQTADLKIPQRCQALMRGSGNQSTQHKVIFLANSQGRAHVLREKLQEVGVAVSNAVCTQYASADDAAVCIAIASVAHGFIDNDTRTVYVPLADFEQTRTKTTHRQPPQGDLLTLDGVEEGDYLVHYEHGIGRFLHVERETNEEFMVLEYAKGQKLFVPMQDLHLLSRYGANMPVELHQLGTQKWQKTRQTIWKRAQDVAAELLASHAARKQAQAPQCHIDEDAYRAFVDAFPHQETDDQKTAITDVERDMQRTTPMERLLCGDVGLGKTEVALRAAFIAVHSGYQVAILVPTTLLCEQHFDRLQERFATTEGVAIAMLSRFQTAKKRTAILTALNTGTINIVVATHSLLKRSKPLKRPGLLIIDEEQRFGVKQKETLSMQYAHIHTLAMTATPIPRSLHMAMDSLRSLSLMTTPPQNRVAIKTFIIKNRGDQLVAAICRELERGGQVFYLYNQVAKIEHEKERLKKLLPEYQIAVAHGQLNSLQLEQTMLQFYHRKIDLLVCSTIIETGIDIPNVNTIIIQQSHRFGLAQLHQLRGRVGRSHLQAYCYLVTPDAISANVQKRLATLIRYGGFGDGFNIAVRDLDLRGAGDLLGKRQSGHMQNVGVGLYLSMLERAVQMMKNGVIQQDVKLFTPKIATNLHFSLTLPEAYIQEVQIRLIYYQQIAQASGHRQLDDIKQDMINRFGEAPLMVDWLFRLAHIQINAQRIGIHTIKMQRTKGILSFQANDNLVQRFLTLINENPESYALKPDLHFTFYGNFTSEAISIQSLGSIMERLIA